MLWSDHFPFHSLYPHGFLNLINLIYSLFTWPSTKLVTVKVCPLTNPYFSISLSNFEQHVIICPSSKAFFKSFQIMSISLINKSNVSIGNEVNTDNTSEAYPPIIFK